MRGHGETSRTCAQQRRCTVNFIWAGQPGEATNGLHLTLTLMPVSSKRQSLWNPAPVLCACA